MLTFKPGIQPDSSIRAFIEAGAAGVQEGTQ